MINSFSGQYRFLSNFYPIVVDFENILFPTVEHAYQAAKTLDIEDRILISNLFSPAKAKQAGKKLQIRDDWDDIKLKVMEELLRKKFRDSELKQKLLETGDELIIEGNYWGRYILGCM